LILAERKVRSLIHSERTTRRRVAGCTVFRRPVLSCASATVVVLMPGSFLGRPAPALVSGALYSTVSEVMHSARPGALGGRQSVQDW
jgi:hypothetical protein